VIQSVNIQNYKSIVDLDLKLGRINVIIGENGAGKSNILEAITLCSAASQGKLDNEFLITRGIRVTKPEFMRSAFDAHFVNKYIELKASDGENNYFAALNNDNKAYSEWIDFVAFQKKMSFLGLKSTSLKIEKGQLNTEGLPEQLINDLEKFANNSSIKSLDQLWGIPEVKHIKNFIIYSPEETSIRQFEREGQIQPLGRNGEGLLKLISTIYDEGDEARINELKENLKLVSWFDDFEFSTKPFEKEMYLKIRDKYIDEELAFLDQRSSNEGFLYLLFYLTLFISDKTPSFFAIDNIDNALNPKLCIQLMKVLTALAKKHDKQVIFTTHNPAILDGLDLTDDEQKLLVVSRKRNGETKVTEIAEKPKSGMKLSESFMSGLLGGLPKNF
jgi:AAA15 family ATPase/GTPase